MSSNEGEKPPVQPPTVPITTERRPIRDLIEALRGQKLDPVTAVLLIGEIRRMEREEERWEMQRSMLESLKPITPEDISAAVEKGMEKVMKEFNKPRLEEMPEWAKEIQKQVQETQKQQQEILRRLSREEREKRRKEIIEEAQRPLLEKISRVGEALAGLEKQIEDIRSSRKDEITQSLEMLQGQISEVQRQVADIQKQIANIQKPEEKPKYPELSEAAEKMIKEKIEEGIKSALKGEGKITEKDLLGFAERTWKDVKDIIFGSSEEEVPPPKKEVEEEVPPP